MSKKTASKTQVKGTLVKPDGTHDDIVRDGSSWKLEDLQALVGGYVTRVPLPNGSKVMLVDEDGGPKKLEPNQTASTYASYPIVGNALIIQRRDLK